MGSNYTSTFNGTYIHMRVGDDFEINPENIERIWRELAVSCKKYKCRRVLSEGIVVRRRMTTMNAFDSGVLAAESLKGLAMACCFYGYVQDELTEFFKNVARNRGLHIEFFTCLERALEWLLAGLKRESNDHDARQDTSTPLSSIVQDKGDSK